MNNSSLCTFVWGPWAKQNHKKAGKCERLLASGRVRWPLSWVTKTPLWRWCEPMKQGYSTLTDQHRRTSNTCRNGDPLKPTLFTPIKEVREPKKDLIFAHSWFLRDEVTGRAWAAGCVADCRCQWQIYYQLFAISWGKLHKIGSNLSFTNMKINIHAFISLCPDYCLKWELHWLYTSKSVLGECYCICETSYTKIFVAPEGAAQNVLNGWSWSLKMKKIWGGVELERSELTRPL